MFTRIFDAWMEEKAPSKGLIWKAIVYGSKLASFYIFETLSWLLIILSCWHYYRGRTDVAVLWAVWAVFCYIGRTEREDYILAEHYKFRTEVKKEIPLDDEK